jgi:hypothetical protein
MCKEIKMKTTRKSAVTFAGAGALALLLSSTAAFAAPQRVDGRDGRQDGVYTDNNNRGYGEQGYDNRENDNRGYDNRGRDGRAANVELRGVVSRIDYRANTVWVRNGRQITMVSLRNGNLRGVRRGQFVAVSGRWIGGGQFSAWNINGVR